MTFFPSQFEDYVTNDRDIVFSDMNLQPAILFFFNRLRNVATAGQRTSATVWTRR